ncbi:hypothetical protein WI27_32805 [Burkholderia cepacia]|nr:hypothetical protein WI27_32805 [Burkholderia cepacia]
MQFTMLLWPPRDPDFQLQIVNFSRRKLMGVLRVDQVNLELQKCYRERFGLQPLIEVRVAHLPCKADVLGEHA